jgi:tetratricopeptide (TPR) repeat protein
MTQPAPSLQQLKRRQAVKVTGFLLGVTALTVGVFHVVRREVVEYRRGQDALARGDATAAATHLDAAWHGGYQTPRAQVDLARALLESGRREEALPHYEAALAAAPTDASLIDTLAGLYQANGQPEKGLALFANLGTPENLSPAALTRLGDLQQQAGNYPAALASYRLAAERAPKEAEIQLRLGITLGWVGRYAEAADALRAAVTIDPNLRLAKLYLARVLMWDGRFADAVTEFRRVLPQ